MRQPRAKPTNTPDEKEKRKPSFSVDWFSNNIDVWTRHLVPALSGKKHARALEIGSYEGQSALWTLEHVLASDGHITCIDDFRVLAPMSREAGVTSIRDRFLANMKAYEDRVTLIEAAAESALRNLPEKSFDFVYIDASKDSRYVLEHAVLAFPLLKNNGFLVFDDYTSSEEHDGSCPRQGINAFVETYAPYVKVRHMSWQVILQRRPMPLKSARLAKCHSEYFQ
jgi:predicted O-methyltransferase YrrM